MRLAGHGSKWDVLGRVSKDNKHTTANNKVGTWYLVSVGNANDGVGHKQYSILNVSESHLALHYCCSVLYLPWEARRYLMLRSKDTIIR